MIDESHGVYNASLSESYDWTTSAESHENADSSGWTFWIAGSGSGGGTGEAVVFTDGESLYLSRDESGQEWSSRSGVYKDANDTYDFTGSYSEHIDTTGVVTCDSSLSNHVTGDWYEMWAGIFLAYDTEYDLAIGTPGFNPGANWSTLDTFAANYRGYGVQWISIMPDAAGHLIPLEPLAMRATRESREPREIRLTSRPWAAGSLLPLRRAAVARRRA